ncbi:CaiB/BaiF CoA transferase family protein [Providencia stuartii]|uniref:CaiB/BaiF CoA transferase family protein n=1 Tax=Providencia stuartii TaxID=588 RepID=UPI00111E2D1C|nr:CoA transferase [Providencia stuartii]
MNKNNTKVQEFNPQTKGALQGIRVIDISRLVAGNMLSLQLGDAGADVIKIEPIKGDPLRAWKEEGDSYFWKVYARNKRSIALNVRDDEGKAILLELLKQADVFIENYRPGTLEKMGLSPEVLHQHNPQLIIVRISGFGQTGPYAQQPGFGTLVEAMSGFAHRTGFADREPVLPPLALADMITGVYGANAVTTALFARFRQLSQGQVIDLSLLESIYSVLGPEAAIYEKTGLIKQRIGSASNTSAPRNVYCCRDGKYVALSGSTQTMALRFFDLIGHSEFADDPRFCDNSARVKNREQLDIIIADWFAQRNRAEALELVREAGVTVGPVYSIDDIVNDPHFIHRQVHLSVADDDFGSLSMPNILPRYSSTPGVWRFPAPKLGEHSHEILSELGFDEQKISMLRQKGAIA